MKNTPNKKTKWDRECPKNNLTGKWVYFDKSGKPNQIKIVPNPVDKTKR